LPKVQIESYKSGVSAPPLKDGLNRTSISRLAHNLGSAFPEFKRRAFVTASLKGLEELELKERVRHITLQMKSHLPSPYLEALEVIRETGSQWEKAPDEGSFAVFAAWPLFQYIEDYGVDSKKESLAALAELTHIFTGEFAIRPFLAAHPKSTFAELRKWTKSPDEHVRRLATEGCRPRLPWAMQVPALLSDPAPGLRVLESLKDDPSEYVRRSVGNHLNDVSKDHPDLVIDVCEAWLRKPNKNREWIVQRATRTLVKAGHPRVWKLLGFAAHPKVELTGFQSSPKRVQLGGELTFQFQLKNLSSTSQKLAVDYMVHFVKADGSTRPKVFKLKVLQLGGKETVRLEKKQPLKPISTRKFYAGEHRIEIVVNGKSVASREFHLRL